MKTSAERGHVSVGQSDAGRAAGEAQQRSPPAVEEEALRAHGGGTAPAQLQRRWRWWWGCPELGVELQSQGAPLRAHGHGGLRGVQAGAGVLHRGDGDGEGD